MSEQVEVTKPVKRRGSFRLSWAFFVDLLRLPEGTRLVGARQRYCDSLGSEEIEMTVEHESIPQGDMRSIYAPLLRPTLSIIDGATTFVGWGEPGEYRE